jgi:hypothetical protein
MKHTILLSVIFLLLFISCLGQEKSKTKIDAPKIAEQCSSNTDQIYNRQKVLQQFAEVLNTSIPEFEKDNRFKFYVNNEKSGGFGIYDLTDTLNLDKATDNGCVEFIDNHIYHVFPYQHPYSFNHIIILENGNLKVFKSINCKDRGETLDDVINYLNLKLVNNKNKSEILERVKNYRRYGEYTRFDNFSTILCQKN